MGLSLHQEDEMKRSDPGHPHPVLVSADPLCKEAPLTTLDSWITPTERFYIRNHFSEIPSLNVSRWRLVMEGHVHHPLDLSLSDILAQPDKEIAATMECAGNSRSYVTPPAEGLAFGHGAVGTARWRGVPLFLLLNRAGLKETAREVVFTGADYGREEEHGIALDLDYRRSLPLDKALDPETLLAYEMNGEALTPAQGYPLRLMVPRWYGMASVKWLIHIEVRDRPFDGFFQRRRYVFINEGVENSLDREAVTALRVKSLITSPRHGGIIPPGACTIRGLAWSGQGTVERVEVSTDTGHSWRDASLAGEPDPNAWRQWELIWDPPGSGHYILVARATDSAGHTQPAIIPWNFRGYGNNSIHTIAVEVPTSEDLSPGNP